MARGKKPAQSTEMNVSTYTHNTAVRKGIPSGGTAGKASVPSAPNDKHLGLMIKYEYDGNEHNYIPDFIIRLTGSTPSKPRYLVLERKGRGGNWEPNRVSAKSAAARKWCVAVTNLGRYGDWAYDICHDPPLVPVML